MKSAIDAVTNAANLIIDARLVAQSTAMTTVIATLLDTLRKKDLLSTDDILAMCDRLDRSASESARMGAKHSSAETATISLMLREGFATDRAAGAPN